MTNRLFALIASCLLLCGCPSTRQPDDATLDALTTGPCSLERSATVVVISNVDGGNDLIGDVAAANVTLVERLLSGDVDGDGTRDFEPLERVRVPVALNMPRVPEGPGDVGCNGVGSGAVWTSIALDRFCPESPRVGQVVFDIRPGDSFQEDLRCFLETRDLDGRCTPETFDTALAALSPADGPVELAPLMGLGDGVNSAYRERQDVLVLLMHQSNRRDDCSRRLHDVPSSVGLCTEEGDEPYCCEANLPPVTRTSEALREILRGRPVVYAAYAAAPAFDPTAEPAARLEEIVADGIDARCVYVAPHPRTVRLARALYPDMHLLPLVCRGPSMGGVAPPIDVTEVARGAFDRLCAP